MTYQNLKNLEGENFTFIKVSSFYPWAIVFVVLNLLCFVAGQTYYFQWEGLWLNSWSQLISPSLIPPPPQSENSVHLEVNTTSLLSQSIKS